MSGLSCPYCSEGFFAPSEELLLAHIRLVHSYEPGFTIQCSFNGCSRTFSSFKAYQNHRRLKHTSCCIVGDSRLTSGPSEDFQELDDANDPQTEAFEIDAPSTEEMKSFSAKWILKTRETRKLTRTAMQGVIEDVADLVTFVSGTLESQTRAVLHANGVNPESISGLKEVFSGAATTPFKDLQSFHQQLQYCRKHFNFIVSYMYVHVSVYVYNVCKCTLSGAQEDYTETNTYTTAFWAYKKACS